MPRKPQSPDVGSRIAGWRQQKGLSQVVVARRAGVAASYLSRIEGGKVHPTVRTATRIADALRMSLNDLLGHSPASRKEHPCLVSASGSCLMDLLDTGHGTKGPSGGERYTPRQLRLLRRFASLLQQSEPKTQNALEVVIVQMLEKSAPAPAGRQ